MFFFLFFVFFKQASVSVLPLNVFMIDQSFENVKYNGTYNVGSLLLQHSLMPWITGHLSFIGTVTATSYTYGAVP